jgi:hypothetical protein
MSEEKKYDSFNEMIINASKLLFENECYKRGRPLQYAVLSSEQIENLKSGKSKMEISTGTIPLVTKEMLEEDE